MSIRTLSAPADGYRLEWEVEPYAVTCYWCGQEEDEDGTRKRRRRPVANVVRDWENKYVVYFDSKKAGVFQDQAEAMAAAERDLIRAERGKHEPKAGG